MRLVVVHPDLGYPERVPLGVEADVAVVGFLLPLDVSHPRAWEDLHAAATEPHLEARDLISAAEAIPERLNTFSIGPSFLSMAVIKQSDQATGCIWLTLPGHSLSLREVRTGTLVRT